VQGVPQQTIVSRIKRQEERMTEVQPVEGEVQKRTVERRTRQWEQAVDARVEEPSKHVTERRVFTKVQALDPKEADPNKTVITKTQREIEKSFAVEP
jgi:hypothetical protein